MTREHRDYIPAAGAYSGGAFELAGRFSTVDLNFYFMPGVAPGATNAVGGGT